MRPHVRMDLIFFPLRFVLIFVVALIITLFFLCRLSVSSSAHSFHLPFTLTQSQGNDSVTKYLLLFRHCFVMIVLRFPLCVNTVHFLCSVFRLVTPEFVWCTRSRCRFTCLIMITFWVMVQKAEIILIDTDCMPLERIPIYSPLYWLETNGKIWFLKWMGKFCSWSVEDDCTNIEPMVIFWITSCDTYSTLEVG